MASNQFRVISLDAANPGSRSHKKLKTHQKKRTGCHSCKVKKVKCDESRPICLRCGRSGSVCVYERAERESSSSPTLIEANALLVSPFYTAGEYEYGTPSRELAHHLHHSWADILWMPQGPKITSLFQSSTLVRHTLLAISACHLRHITDSVPQHRIAEHFQQSTALNNVRKAINRASQKRMAEDDLKAFLLSVCLLNVLAFALPKADESLVDQSSLNVSWIFAQGEEGWLTLQAGLGPLLNSVSRSIEETLGFISEVFLGTNEEDWAFNVVGRDGLKGVPGRWMRFFGLEDPTRSCECTLEGRVDQFEALNFAVDSEIYRSPVALTAKLRALPPTRHNAFRTLQFLGKIGPEFRASLRQGDLKAIWLLGYWFGLLCRFERLWWCEQRMKRDHGAVCVYLEQARPWENDIDGDDKVLWCGMMEELWTASLFAADD